MTSWSDDVALMMFSEKCSVKIARGAKLITPCSPSSVFSVDHRLRKSPVYWASSKKGTCTSRAKRKKGG